MNGLKRHVLLAAAIIGIGSVCRAEDTPGHADHPEQKLEQAKRQQKEETQAQGDRKVEVREMALWGLGELPPKLMHKAMERLGEDSEEARRLVMQAANILELQASLAIQKSDLGAQSGAHDTHGDADRTTTAAKAGAADRAVNSAYQTAGGGDWSNTRDQELWRAAGQLRELALGIEFKQVLTKEDLREPFAKAAVAMANFYQRAAEAGLARGSEEQTGYTLKGAAEYLAAAHAYGARRPTAEASRAIFDADRLADQIIKLSRPTTYQTDTKAADAARAGHAPDPADRARTAAARQGGLAQSQQKQPMPPEAGQVIKNLGAAIAQLGTDFGQRGAPPQGVANPGGYQGPAPRSVDH